MKTATIIFVALTVFSGLFQESSSAPSIVGGLLGGSGSGSQNSLVVLKPVGDLLTSILGKLPPKLGKIYKKILDLRSNTLIACENDDIEAVQNLMVDFFNAIKEFKADLLEKLGDKEILEKALQIVEQIVKEVLKALGPIVKDIVNVVKGVISKLKEVIAGILEKVKGELKVLLEELLEKLVDLFKAVVELVDNVTDASLNKVIELLKAIKELVTKIIGILKSESGKDIDKEHKDMLEKVVGILINKLLVLVEVIVKVVKTLIA